MPEEEKAEKPTKKPAKEANDDKTEAAAKDKPEAANDDKTEEAVAKAHEAETKAEAAAKAAKKAEAAAQKAIAKAEAAQAEADAAAEEEYKALAEEAKAEAAKAPDYTYKRQGEEIFRREMGEPEFFLDKNDRFPRPILSAEEEEQITRNAEVFEDRTPQYVPQNVLSPEFGGMSNYERGVDEFLKVAKLELESLRKDPEATQKEVSDARDKVTYLESLHENYYIGMNVFRTAKGGRDKLKS